MRGSGEIRVCQPRAGQPIAGAREPADIGKMIADIGERRTNGVGIRRSAALLQRQAPFEDPLGYQRPADFGEELAVEPAGQAPDFNPAREIARQQAVLAELGPARLVEIFRDDLGIWHWRRPLLDQHRSRTGRVEREEFLTSLPHALLDKTNIDAVLAEREAYKARMRAKRLMEQPQHGVFKNTRGPERDAQISAATL